MSKWQDFSTAPTDGRRFLAYREGIEISVCMGDGARRETRNEKIKRCWYRDDGSEICGQLPTHWMPLPDGLDENDDSPSPPRLYDAWAAVAHQHRDETGEVPVVVGVDLYEHFGNRAKITEISFYSRGMEVLLEGPFGETAEVDATDLVLRAKRKA